MKNVYQVDEGAYKVLTEVLRSLIREEAPLAAGRRRELAIRLTFVQDTMLANATQVVEPADRNSWLIEERRKAERRNDKKVPAHPEATKEFHIFGRDFPATGKGA